MKTGSPPNPGSPTPLQSKRTILVVEDDQNVRSMILRHLSHGGYDVKTASDGMEGLNMLEQGSFDLVITDIVMPYVSGIGIVARVKSQNPRVPVIAITGYGEEPESLASESRADLVLSKPVKMAVLMGHIRRLLGNDG